MPRPGISSLRRMPAMLTLWQVSDAIARLRQLLNALPDGSPLMAFLPEVDGNA